MALAKTRDRIECAKSRGIERLGLLNKVKADPEGQTSRVSLAHHTMSLLLVPEAEEPHAI